MCSGLEGTGYPLALMYDTWRSNTTGGTVRERHVQFDVVQTVRRH